MILTQIKIDDENLIRKKKRIIIKKSIIASAILIIFRQSYTYLEIDDRQKKYRKLFIITFGKKKTKMEQKKHECI